MRIEPLDAAGPAQMAAWHATYLAASTFGRDHPTPYMLPEVRAGLLTANPGEKVLAWTGSLHGEVAVAAAVYLPLMDNRNQAWVEIYTLPRLRGRGFGSTMLEHLSLVARQHGRGLLAADVAYPYDAPVDGTGHRDVEFVRRHGFTLGIADVQRVLDLPVDAARLQRLADSAAPHAQGYLLRQFSGPVPEDIVESFGQLIGSLVTEAPMGELELEPEVFDHDRIRADEQLLQASGRQKYTTVALSADATVAAYSELVVPEHDPGRVYQWGTLVLPDHRGHRLGLATKTRNLLWLQAERPDLRLLSTYNAAVNPHMIAINEAMGFRPVERLGEFQKHLT